MKKTLNLLYVSGVFAGIITGSAYLSGGNIAPKYPYPLWSQFLMITVSLFVLFMAAEYMFTNGKGEDDK